MDWLTIGLLALVLVLMVVVLALLRRLGATAGDGRRPKVEERSLLGAVVDWLTAWPLRWTRLAYAGGLVLVIYWLFQMTDFRGEFPEAWWLSLGIVLQALAAALLAPDPSKSEVLTLAEKIVQRDQSDS